MGYDRGMTTSTEKRTIIITGASAGIGLAAARELARDNRVIIVGRSKTTISVAKEMGVEYFRADYADLASVRILAEKILKAAPQIDLLINNAGGTMSELKQTKDGFEQTVQVNYLAQFLLTDLLMDRLVKSKGGIINTSSAAHMFARLHVEDMQDAKGTFAAYSNTKLLDLIHAQELARRYAKKSVQAVSFHPGVVASNFGNKTSGPFSWMYNTAIRRLLLSSEQGADTLIWLATHRDLWQSGGYYVKRKLASVTGLAKDPTIGSVLWDKTRVLLGL